VRSGSMRVKNKNIRPFAGSNLLEIKIKQLLTVKELDGIVVNSNSDEMLRIAGKYPVELVKREEKFATNSASPNDCYENMAQNLRGDAVIHVTVTHPLLLPKTISKIIRKFKEGKHDSVVAAFPIKKFLFNEGKPMNYDSEKIPRSQDLPNVMAISFAASIISRDLMLNRRSVVGRHPFFHEITATEAVDIDTPFDFLVAEYLYQKIYG